jgi:hypothetical protein
VYPSPSDYAHISPNISDRMALNDPWSLERLRNNSFPVNSSQVVFAPNSAHSSTWSTNGNPSSPSIDMFPPNSPLHSSFYSPDSPTNRSYQLSSSQDTEFAGSRFRTMLDNQQALPIATSPYAKPAYSTPLQMSLPTTAPATNLLSPTMGQQLPVLKEEPHTAYIEYQTSASPPIAITSRRRIQPAYQSNEDAPTSRIRGRRGSRAHNYPSGGRRPGSHLDAEKAASVSRMRKLVACWHCVLQRDAVRLHATMLR